MANGHEISECYGQQGALSMKQPYATGPVVQAAISWLPGLALDLTILPLRFRP